MRFLSSRWLRGALAVAGFIFIGIVLATGGLHVEVLRALDGGRLAIVFGTFVAAVLAAAWSWAKLMEGEFRQVGRSYLTALPTKHVPGGLGLPLSQLSHETSRGTHPTTVFVRLVQHFLISVGSGGIATLGLLAVAREPWGTSWAVSILLIIALAFGHPRLLSAPLRWVGRTEERPAPAKALAQATLATTGAIGLMGLAFGVLLEGLAGPTDEFHVAALFALSWTLGFAAVPVPAGIGLREALLVGLLAPAASGLIVLASLLLRLVAATVDLFVSLAARAWRPRE